MANSASRLLAPAIVTSVGAATIAAAWGFELVGGVSAMSPALLEKVKASYGEKK